MERVVVIGAGVGGLTAAALLAKAGLDVTVLEAHVYPGGCAATFFSRGYRFDAGATLSAGFYEGGPMDILAKVLDKSWLARSTDVAMAVHLPGVRPIALSTNCSQWKADRLLAFGPSVEPFWRWQARMAETVWSLALQLPPWPPQDLEDLRRLGWAALRTLWGHSRSARWLAVDALRPLAAHLKGTPRNLRLFLDAQLLISAQTTSQRANALYGAAALDMPRRGVVHLEGGIGAIAEGLAESVRQSGGRVVYRRRATRLVMGPRGPVAVETDKGQTFPADLVVANLTPARLGSLLSGVAPGGRPPGPADGWGAFVIYAGLDGAVIPPGFPLHHQVVVGEPLGEGNSAFLSISPDWDGSRAPAGKRAVTLSTHVDLRPWWRLREEDPAGYEALKGQYAERLLVAAAKAIPEFRDGMDLSLLGTPVTFERYTGREWGWVGGFPQSDLARSLGTRREPGVWLVGDSIFPGQSTAAVAMGGMRVAEAVLKAAGVSAAPPQRGG